MGAFTSGKVRNDDPRPYLGFTGKRYATAEEPLRDEPSTYYDRRPEFDLPPREDVNPILAAFRTREDRALTSELWAMQIEGLRIFGGWRDWDSPDNPFHSLTLATEEQADHAHKVLSKLWAIS